MGDSAPSRCLAPDATSHLVGDAEGGRRFLPGPGCRVSQAGRVTRAPCCPFQTRARGPDSSFWSTGVRGTPFGAAAQPYNAGSGVPVSKNVRLRVAKCLELRRGLWACPALESPGPSLWVKPRARLGCGGREDTVVGSPACASSAGLRFPSGKEGVCLQVAKDRAEAVGLGRWPWLWLPRGSLAFLRRNLFRVGRKLKSLGEFGKQLASGHTEGRGRARTSRQDQSPTQGHSQCTPSPQTILEGVPTHLPALSPMTSQVK